eukprot:TRINITY_DN6277_c0_g1_i3.p1 TRINITY_DN6277_c0_g1~~TRINITY_DN6277_c0_g1_i3.p1  ORF type:complete len:752 (+),score=161.54 TRINITY_DN6277_c0_g1_i3:2123-4378(+)
MLSRLVRSSSTPSFPFVSHYKQLTKLATPLIVSTFKPLSYTSNLHSRTAPILTTKHSRRLFHTSTQSFSSHSNQLHSTNTEDINMVKGSKFVNRLRFDLTPESLTALCDELIANARRVYDDIAAIPEGKQTWENTFQKIADEDADFDTLSSNCEFPSSVSTSKELRDASTEAEKKFSKFGIEMSMREDVYKSLLAFQATHPKLAPEDHRFVEKTLLDFKRAGLALPQDKRDELKKLKERISELCIQFQRNVNEDTSFVQLTREELEGVPDAALGGYEEQEVDGKKVFKVTMKYPDYFPAMKYSKLEETRKKLDKCYGTRCMAQNTPILEEIIALRHQAAHLLGYPTHAHYVHEIRMAKKPENVQNFYDGLRPKLEKLALKELEKMLALKKKHTGDKFDNKINSWDFLFYDRLTNEEEYSVNEEEISEYFPLEYVTNGILSVYQDLLSLRFELEPDAQVWHDDVSTYAVYDKKTNDLMGHFYLDMHPREGKYSHAAAFPLQKGCFLRAKEGKAEYQLPTTAMVCNFSKPQVGKPSLLKHDEVETYFHEFGHVMHGICARAKYSRFAGTSTERDFVECPSQMLENWCWQKEVLLRLSSHFQTGKPLPDDILNKMVAAKNANAGLLHVRQVFYGVFDITVHTQEKVNTAEVFNKLKEEITYTVSTPGTNGSASFGHLTGGYDASYYGYLYSKVFSADLFSVFKEKGVLNPEVGLKYRNTILLPGGSKDGEQILRDFLGRDPILEPFLESIGLTK